MKLMFLEMSAGSNIRTSCHNEPYLYACKCQTHMFGFHIHISKNSRQKNKYFLLYVIRVGYLYM